MYQNPSHGIHRMISQVITATMLLLQFILYSSSFVVTLKNEILGAALELCQLKLKQFSPYILKFSTKHEDNPFTLNCFMVPRTCLFIFDAGSRRLGSNNFRSSIYKKRNGRFGPCFQTIFPFLMTMVNLRILSEYGKIRTRKTPNTDTYFIFNSDNLVLV